jgi:NADH-quinone oxidoreductase subunit C
MENTTIISKLHTRFNSDILSVDMNSDMPAVIVSKSAIHEVVGFLKSEGYLFLTDLCGVHYPDQELELGVVYHLHDFVKNRRIRIKTFVAKDQPALPTMTDIFSGANWMERETYDFYGILFEGHPNLNRILNVEYLDYFPMRKEYPLEDPTREDKDDRYFGR